MNRHYISSQRRLYDAGNARPSAAGTFFVYVCDTYLRMAAWHSDHVITIRAWLALAALLMWLVLIMS